MTGKRIKGEAENAESGWSRPTATAGYLQERSLRILFIVFCGVCFMSYSHNRITVQPSLRNFLLTSLSLCLLPEIFSRQYLILLLGFINLRGWQCQKSESTNTTIFFLRKTISGLPDRDETCAAKYILRLLSPRIIIFSGTVPVERIFRIFFLR